MIGLMALVLPLLALLAAFCVNSAHMQLTKTELMVATDAAARAGGRAFSEYQTVDDAKEAAITTAALNTVNSEPLVISGNDGSNEIEFGTTNQPGGFGSRYYFEKIPTSTVEQGLIVASALRVNADHLSNVLVSGLLDQDTFEPAHSAVAMQVDRDISLILDRSGSMEWVTFNWPSGVSPWTYDALDAGVDEGLLTEDDGSYYYASGVDSDEYQQWAWEHFHELGPAPQRPWDDLVTAVDAFLNVLEGTSQEEQVSIASYASSATLDTYLEDDYANVRSTVDALNTGGSTAIGLGMQQGIQALLDSAARPYAQKTMVVMTDGNHNRGISPLDVAQSFAGSYDLTIHTVTFGGGADQDLMADVAAACGGRHYHAADGSELVAIFEEIANNLPTILTQ
ncbi:MAG: VWA domain-containing protein [Planctomycetota bacterium]